MRRLIGRLQEVVADGVAALLTPVGRALGLRIVSADLDYMGNLCNQLEAHIKATKLGWLPRKPTVFIPQPGRGIGNPCAVDHYREYVRVEARRVPYALLFRMGGRGLRFPHLRARLPDGHEVGGIELTHALQRAWEDAGLQPLLRLSESERRRGWDVLEGWGLRRSDWFVCLHAREPGWRGEGPDSEHRHSNADVMAYLSAVEEIVRRGGWAIRMGDRSMKRLPPLERVVDYAHTPGRTDWMDVFLSAECRFFLGSTSGLFALPWAFGVPVALANWVPLAARPWSSRDLFVPKLYRLAGTDTPVPFARGFAPDVRHAGHVSTLVRAGLDVIDTTPDEIRELAIEMLERLDGTWRAAAGDEERRAQFDSLADFYPGGFARAAPGAVFLRAPAPVTRTAEGP